MATLKRIYEGLEIIRRTTPNNLDPDTVWFSAEHDQIWCGNHAVHKMSKYQLMKMEDLGWFEDEGSWSHYT